MNQKDLIRTVRRMIDERRKFRIGSRGICIDLIPHNIPHEEGWTVGVPRASYSVFVDTVDVIEIVRSISGDIRVGLLQLGVEGGYVNAGSFDLEQYDTVTLIHDRI